jgi:hypothetical protein
LNEQFLSEEEFTNYQNTMTSIGVRDWLVATSRQIDGCALKKLSAVFGKHREDCNVCPFCCTKTLPNVFYEDYR